MRVTNRNDPVVHLPFKDWGFQHSGVHSSLYVYLQKGEYWIHSKDLPISSEDIKICSGDEDETCLEGQVIPSQTYSNSQVIQHS
jgi:hypothetical protein